MTSGPQDPLRDGLTVRAGPPPERPGPPLKVHVREAGDASVVELAGRMTLGEGNLVLRETVDMLLAAGRRRIVIYMLDVALVDSASVGEIVACNRRIREAGGELKLVLAGKVLDTFRMTRLDRVFEVHDDLDAALAGF